MRSLADLLPYERNARTHSPEQVEQLAKSIREFGFTNPVLVTSDNMIVAGHGRIEAAKAVGLTHVPTLVVGKDWSPSKLRAYILADNQLALNAGWDEELLISELEELAGLGVSIDLAGFDIEFLERNAKKKKRQEEAAQPQLMGIKYQVVVTVADENAQGELAQRLEVEGYEVRILML